MASVSKTESSAVTKMQEQAKLSGSSNDGGATATAEEAPESRTTPQTLTLLFEKQLTASDINRQQSRLLIPAEQAPQIFCRLQHSARQALQHDPKRGVIIEFHEQLSSPAAAAPCAEKEEFKSWTWLFKQWQSSGSFVLMQGWVDFVVARTLQCGSRVRFLCDDSSHTFYVSVIHVQEQAPPPSSTQSSSSNMMLLTHKQQHLCGAAAANNVMNKKRKKVHLQPAPLATITATTSSIQAKKKTKKMQQQEETEVGSEMELCICLRLRTGRWEADPVVCPTCKGLL